MVLFPSQIRGIFNDSTHFNTNGYVLFPSQIRGIFNIKVEVELIYMVLFPSQIRGIFNRSKSNYDFIEARLKFIQKKLVISSLIYK